MEKYLSDVLDTSLFEKGYLNVIWAPCGCGKTTAAINMMLPLASVPRRAIYLIDTKIGNERLAQHHQDKLEMPWPYYAHSIANTDSSWGEGMDKVCVTTYAQFGSWCRQYPGFAERYEYIICDEPQNLVNFSEIGKWVKGEVDVNLHKVARQAICDAVRRGNTTVIGMTATPKPLEKLECALYEVPIDRTELHHYTENQVIRYSNLDLILDNIKVGMRGGIYMKHVKPMIALGAKLRERGFHPLMLWSLNYEDAPLSAEQLRARKYIIDNEAVPDEYDIFMFNATAETSINIYSHMDFFIAHNTSATNIIQSRGRYRNNLETFYVEDVRGVTDIPESYLGKPLDRKELKEMRALLGIKKDKDRHEISIDDMLLEFSNHGYNVEYSKRNRKDCFVIQKQ